MKENKPKFTPGPWQAERQIDLSENPRCFLPEGFDYECINRICF